MHLFLNQIMDFCNLPHKCSTAAAAVSVLMMMLSEKKWTPSATSAIATAAEHSTAAAYCFSALSSSYGSALFLLNGKRGKSRAKIPYPCCLFTQTEQRSRPQWYSSFRLCLVVCGVSCPDLSLFVQTSFFFHTSPKVLCFAFLFRKKKYFIFHIICCCVC